jgi:hypothetical protein
MTIMIMTMMKMMAIILYIPEVPGANLGLETGFPKVL